MRILQMQYENMKRKVILTLAGILTAIICVSNIYAAGMTALMDAAERGNIVQVRALREAQQGQRDDSGKTALIYAAWNGHADCVQELLAEAQLQDHDGMTALMFAAWSNHTDCVQLLLAELNMRDQNGMTALMFTTWGGNINSVPLLMQEAGIRDNRGRTALMTAAESGAYETSTGIVELLLGLAGAQDNRGHTALTHAFRCSYAQSLELTQLLANQEEEIMSSDITDLQNAMEHTTPNKAQCILTVNNRLTALRQQYEQQQTAVKTQTTNIGNQLEQQTKEENIINQENRLIVTTLNHSVGLGDQE